jgi:hypothetical protein
MTASWTIVSTTEYQSWCGTLSPGQARSIDRKVELLRIYGPALGRPHVDHIKGSKYPNLKELRISGGSAIRVFFCFDSQRQAVLLIGGNKSTNKDWYKRMIQQADQIMDSYMEQEEMK